MVNYAHFDIDFWVQVLAVGSETAPVVVWVWVRVGPINVLVNALSTLMLRLLSAVSLILRWQLAHSL